MGDDIKLTLNYDRGDNKEAKAKARDAEKRKHKATETMEEAWARVFKTKMSDTDRKRYEEVKEAMEAGEIGREEGNTRPFSAAEAKRLWGILEERKKEGRIKRLVESTPSNYFLIDTFPKMERLRDLLLETKNLVAIDCETFGEDKDAPTDPWRGKMAGFSVSVDDKHFYVPLNHDERPLGKDTDVMEFFKEPLESVWIAMHNAPFDGKFFLVQYGVDLVKKLYIDTQLMAWAADENASHALKDLSEKWLGMKEAWSFDKLFARINEFNKVPLDAALVYAAGDTEKTLKLYEFMRDNFRKTEEGRAILDLVMDEEMVVRRRFIYSDVRGMNFDIEQALILDKQFEEEVEQIQKEANEIYGDEVPLSSPTKLKVILYEELGLPDLGKGSTKTALLEKITSKHPLVQKILDYRAVGQLRSHFTSKLPDKVKYDGLIHPDHNSWGTVTSRFTCSEPNTQQMPSKRPEVRRLFFPRDGMIFFAIDYSQIELRVLAHLANEEVLIKAFEEGRDIHSTTAAQITGIPYEQIEAYKDVEGSKEQKARKNAKPVNFGIAYGLTKYGLANQLSISEKEAQEIIDGFFEGYPGIKRYMDEQKRLARQNGFVLDMFGKKRRLKAQYRRGYASGADRQAGNFPIQCSAGTILKKAVKALEPILEKWKEYHVDIRLQIHDELLFEADENIPREAMEEIRDVMAGVVELVVPVLCDVEISPERWMDNLSLDQYYGEVA